MDESEPYHVLELMGNAIVGGVERYVETLTRHLPKQGFHVTCVAPYESSMTENLREKGTRVYILKMDEDPPWSSIQYLKELVHVLRVDLLHAHMPRAQALAGLVGNLSRKPVIMTVHGMEIPSWELGIAKTTGAHVNVVCEMAYLQALSLGLPEERVRFIPNGVDIDVYRPRQNKSVLRKTLGLPEEATIVGYVGRLSHEKGPDMFVQLAQHVHRARPDVHYVMVGDGQMCGDIQAQVEENGLKDCFHLMGTRDTMQEVYPALDVLALTSRVEGMPLSLLEGMACGLPVAAMSVGGVPEVVVAEKTGYIGAVGDCAGLGDAVTRLIDNPDLRKEMGAAARERVSQKHNLELTLGILTDQFRGLIQENSTAP